MAVATPKAYEVPSKMRDFIKTSGSDARIQGDFQTSNVPEEAIRDADLLVTDTWVSMGQEADKKEKMEAYKGYQITSELAEKGKAKAGWKFMHCLPRHPEEVSDEVFYNPQRSLVFQEAENRLWATIAILEAFVVNKGRIV